MWGEARIDVMRWKQSLDKIHQEGTILCKVGHGETKAREYGMGKWDKIG